MGGTAVTGEDTKVFDTTTSSSVNPSGYVQFPSVYQCWEGVLSIVDVQVTGFCRKFGFKYLVGHGGNRQAGEGIHLDSLQH